MGRFQPLPHPASFLGVCIEKCFVADGMCGWERVCMGVHTNVPGGETQEQPAGGSFSWLLAKVAHLPACCLSGGQNRPPTGRVGVGVPHPSPRDQGQHASLHSPWRTAGFEGSSCVSPGPCEDRTTSGSSVHPRPSMTHGAPHEIACCPGTTAGQSVRSNDGYT